MAAIVKSKMNRKDLISMAVILLLMFGFQYLPTFGPVTKEGMQVLGIFFGCIFAWLVGEVMWPSVLAIVMLGFVGDNNVGSAFSAAFGNSTMHMVFLALLFCHAMEKSGLLETISKFILTRKFAKRDPWMLCLAFWIATAFTCALTSAATAITILCWDMFYDVAKRLGLEKRSPYVTVVIVGIALASYLGGVFMPYNSFSQIVFGVLASINPEITIDFTAYVLIMLFTNIVGILAMYIVAKYLLRIKIEYHIPEDAISRDALKLNTRKKRTAMYFLLLCFSLIAPFYLPSDWVLTSIFSRLGFVGSFAGFLILLSITDDGEGKKLFNIGSALQVGVPYGMVALITAALALSSNLTNPATGVQELLSLMFSPISNISSPFFALVALLLAGLLLTNLINNMVCIALMVPVGMGLVTSIGADAHVMITLLCPILMLGIVFPSSSMFGAALHGNSEWLKPRHVYFYATILVVTVGAVVAVLGVPFGEFIFGIVQ